MVKDMDLKYSHKNKSQTKFGFYSTGDTPILIFLMLINGFNIKDLCKLPTKGKEQCKYTQIYTNIHKYIQKF